MLKKVKSRFAVIQELFRFLGKRRLWWLIPMIVVMLFFGLLIVFAATSQVAPFIYTLF